ncbi:MAG: OsmC family peroxiredoxin [Flavobacteriales bacterium]|nr:OsmC family peroxiredoxin [Flavobacteriales bacterium]
MSIRKANAVWNGTLKEGKGTMAFTGYNGPFTFASRFEEGSETNPEELVGAAHAGCFSMFLSALLSGEGLNPESIETVASVTLERDDTGPVINRIVLNSKVKCEGLSKEKFDELTAKAKANCPISRLYAGSTAEIVLEASLQTVLA